MYIGNSRKRINHYTSGSKLQEGIFRVNSSSLNETVSKIELTIVSTRGQFAGELLPENFRFMGYEFDFILRGVMSWNLRGDRGRMFE